jgi:hypothetical protein
MTVAQLYRLSGATLVVSAVLGTLSSVLGGVLFSDATDPSALTNPLNLALSTIGAIGALLALLGLPACTCEAHVTAGGRGSRAWC